MSSDAGAILLYTGVLVVEDPGRVEHPAGRSGIRRAVVNRTPVKSFRCEVISENVTIALRRRTVFGGRGPLFIRCSEVDCQYVDANEPPCPLTLDLFAEEIREREAQRAQRR